MYVPTQKNTSPESQSSVLWWVPLAWAVNLVNQMGASAASETQIIPKDSKDVLSSLLKFEKDLEMQKARYDNPLPFFYKRVSQNNR